MEENLFKALSSFSVTFFIITAIMLFFSLYNESSTALNIVNKKISDRVTVYETLHKEKVKNVVNGASITGAIKSGLETDIAIDSVLVSKSLNPEEVDFTLIDNPATYWVEYLYNASGDIILVKYYKE